MNKKGMAIVIICLFIGASVVPTISGNSNESRYEDDFITTTGPIPPENCGKDINPVFLTGQKVISGVPAYKWRHGCSPTSAGMIIGYWDSHGFDDLVEGSTSSQNNNVNSMIASYENYVDYCLPIDSMDNILPDKSELPLGDEHEDNCIADFMKTSQSIEGLAYGGSWRSNFLGAFASYVLYNTNHDAWGRNYVYDSFSWIDYCEQIDSNHPVLLSVDADGDGSTDHSICAIGYDDNYHYACHNTWDREIHWYEFRGVGVGNKFGIGYALFFSVENVQPVASFSWNPYSIDINETVTFTANESYDKDGEIISYEWTINNIDIKTGSWFNYVFDSYGVHIVELKVTDDFGDETTSTKHVIVGDTDLSCMGNLVWYNVTMGLQQSGIISISNIGDPNTPLNWRIQSYPSWGDWSFSSTYGSGLTPEDGNFTVDVIVIAPEEKSSYFSGEIKIVNNMNSNDYEIIPITLSTPKNKAINTPFLNFLENHPRMFPLLRQLLEL